MKRDGLLSGVIALGAALWMLLSPTRGAGGDADKGKVIYEKHCLACHGLTGRGDGPMGKVLHPPATDFTAPQHKKRTDAELLAIIENGTERTAMSGWKRALSEQEMGDVLAYIRRLGQ